MRNFTIDLMGETILVTGASRGIGAAMARHFLVSGAQVIGTYAKAPGDLASLKDTYGDQLSILHIDLMQDPAGTVFDRAVQACGPVSAIVNNAGIMPETPLAAADDIWLRDWQSVWQVNVQAVADLCRAAVLDWQARRTGGRIVSVASRAAFRGDTPDFLHYAASKGAVVGLMRSLARGLAGDGILAFTLAPGWVNTDMAAVAYEPGNEHLLAELPMGEPAPPEEVARMAGFLISGAVDHATGATFDINGASYIR